MARNKGASLFNLKLLNQLQIRRVIYYNGPLTRQQIANELGVSLPTVTTNVAAMLADGLLTEYEGESTTSHAGRRPQLVDFNADSRFAVGLEFGPYGAFACVTNLRGRILYKKELSSPSKNYERMLIDVSTQCQMIIRESKVPPHQVLGIGVGLPGFIDSQRGTVRTGLYSSWADRELAADLRRQTYLPVWIDNNARMRTYWREMFSGRDTPSTFVYLFVSKGIACPLMIKNDILAGKHASAGEIGHTTILPDGPICPTCGRKGCLESLSSEAAILAQVQATLGHDTTWDIQKVLMAQRQGNSTVCDIMKQAVGYLGLAAANIFNFISPNLLSIDGLIFENEENRKELIEVVQSNLFGLSTEEAKIEFLPHNSYSGASGAAAFVVRQSLLA
ncbi:MAG: ROK family transcriptional regulator [Clostridiaceae bacterium]|nr:ROK family transcriptional regulator [Clostridiaceae bacterium]